MANLVDIVVHMFGPQEIAARQAVFDAALMDQVRMQTTFGSGPGTTDSPERSKHRRRLRKDERPVRDRLRYIDEPDSDLRLDPVCT